MGGHYYVKKPEFTITAVQMNLETPGLTYTKWGGEQRASAGDWLVDADGEVYTIEAKAFERTYTKVSPGVYRKHARIWAEKMEQAGSLPTLEGVSAYEAGDYVVWEDPDQEPSHCVKRARFEDIYEEAPNQRK